LILLICLFSKQREGIKD